MYLVAPLSHHGAEQRQTKAHLLYKAVYVETWSGRFDEGYSHARLWVFR
jgi:hypothetical protein